MKTNLRTSDIMRITALFSLLVLFLFVSSGVYSQKTKTMAHTIQFEYGNTEIPVEEAALLKVFVDIIKGLPDNHFFILPQTHLIYNPEQVKAAQRRAEKVFAFLLSEDIPSSSVTMMEVMESLPDDDTEGASDRKYQVVINGVFTEAAPPVVAPTPTPPKDSVKTAVKPDFAFSVPKKISEAEIIEPVQDIKTLYPLWDIEPQTFVVAPERDTLIETIRGLMIYIPAYCFQAKDSEKAGKEIEVILREYFKKSDIAAYYYGSKPESCISPFGIYHIEAKSNGNLLTLKQGESLSLLFPQILAGEEIQLYEGTRKQENYQMTWKQISDGKGIIRGKRPLRFPEPAPSGLFASQVQEEENLVKILRTDLRLTKNQAILLKETLYSQMEYERNTKKGKAPIPPRAASAYLFSVTQLNQDLMLGKPASFSESITINVDYLSKQHTLFQLVNHLDKSIIYPETSSGEIRFKAPKADYTLVGIQYAENKIRMSILDVPSDLTVPRIAGIEFNDYDDLSSVRKALRVLDYREAKVQN